MAVPFQWVVAGFAALAVKEAWRDLKDLKDPKDSEIKPRANLKSQKLDKVQRGGKKAKQPMVHL